MTSNDEGRLARFCWSPDDLRTVTRQVAWGEHTIACKKCSPRAACDVGRPLLDAAVDEYLANETPGRAFTYDATDRAYVRALLLEEGGW